MSSEFDIIFAGGGTAACVIAGRLIAANPSLKILIVEQGQHSLDVPIHVQPCRFIENLAPTSTTVTFHTAKPNPHMNGRVITIPSGKCVGGGSAVNFMAYVRGAASDYDGWAKLGNEGWSFNELLPFIKKIETFTPKADQPTHGYSGPVRIIVGYNLGLGKEFLDVGNAYDPDRPQVDDNNDFKTSNARSPWYKYIDPETGRRCDAASRYLYPHSQNANLDIRVGKCVKRVIVEHGQAVGIEYTNDVTTSCPGDTNEFITVTASKLVVLSAGAFGSPAILERSGIGAASVLDENKVPVIVDLPGVGENYHDHIVAFPVYHASDDTDTMDDVWSDPKEIEAWLEEWICKGTGKIAHNGCEAMTKIRPSTTELESIGPEFQWRWESFFQHFPDKSVAIISAIPGYLGYNTMFPPKGRKFITMDYYLLYPQSLGSVHITSGEDANAPLDFDPDFYSDAGDRACLMMLYKKTREIARRMPAYRGEAAFFQPAFAADSPAACKETDGPVPLDAPDIVYSDEDDKAIEEFHQNSVQTAWHSLGTCSMKPRKQGGVVDSRLNVYGVKNLKVADLSICPTNVGNNTYSTTLLIGEKAAVIIAQDLKINIP